MIRVFVIIITGVLLSSYGYGQDISGLWYLYPNTNIGDTLTLVRPKVLGPLKHKVNPDITWYFDKRGYLNISERYYSVPTKNGIINDQAKEPDLSNETTPENIAELGRWEIKGNILRVTKGIKDITSYYIKDITSYYIKERDRKKMILHKHP